MALLYRDDSDFWTEGDSSGSDESSGDERPFRMGGPPGAPQGLAASAGSAGAEGEGSVSALEVLPSLTAFIPPPLAVPPVSAEALEELQQLRLQAENSSSSSSSSSEQQQLTEAPRGPATAWESDAEGGEEGLNFLPPQRMQQEQQQQQVQHHEQPQDQQHFPVHEHQLLLPLDLLGEEGEPQGLSKFRINFELMEDVPTNINPYAAPPPVIECEPLPQQHQQQQDKGSPPSAAAEEARAVEKEAAEESEPPRRPKSKAIRKRWCIDDVADVSHFRRSLREIRKERAAAAAAAAAVRQQLEQQQQQQEQAAGDSNSSAALEYLLRAQVAPPPDAVTAAAAAVASAAAASGGAGGQSAPAGAAPDAAAGAPDADLTAEEEPLALEFGFSLDDFQKRAILRLQKNQCVFVAAHTSAGKTVVAEYAIALAMQRRRRCVFTSPLKALSNQKYREFKQKFGSHPSASMRIQCRATGDELIGQLDCAIFDEAHYANDAERGVVWEESLILLPQHVNIVLLSATLPNYREFCDWLGAVKQREVFAQTTTKRPTPLRHFLYSRDKAFLLIDEGGTFNAAAYSQAYAHVNGKKAAVAVSAKAAAQSRGGGSAGAARGTAGAARGGSRTAQSAANKAAYQSSEAKLKTESQRLQTLIRYLAKAIAANAKPTQNRLPKWTSRCPSFTGAEYIYSPRQVNLAPSVADHECLKRLSPADRELRQIDLVLKLAQRGIGIHHGGLLPIIKEMAGCAVPHQVEILFQRGLVRVLFATETLAVGLNMPARTVVFTDTKKHDGERLRPLLASEYTQMAGRAGRRGIDSCGNVYVFAPDEVPSPKDLTTMMVEKATPMASRFRLTYQTLLLLHAKADSLSVESLLRSSFREAARNTQRPVMKRNLKRCNKASSNVDRLQSRSLVGLVLNFEDDALAALPPINCVFGCPTIGEFAKMQCEWRRVAQRVHMKVWQCRQVATSIFTLGRLVYVHSLSDMIPGSMPAVVINIDFVPLIQGEPPTFCMLVLLPPRYSLAALEAQAASGSAWAAALAGLQVSGEGVFFSFRSMSLPFACAGIGARGTISTGLSMGASWGADVGLAEIEDLGGGKGRLGGGTEWVVLKGVSLNCVEQVIDRRLTPPANFSKTDPVHLSTLATDLSRAVGDDGGAVGVKWEELLPKVDLDFVQPLLKYNELQKSMGENQCATCELKEQHLALAARRMQASTSASFFL
ncbi:hypothetical protein ACSSS7_000606 [Eimeria intestinalis]